MSETWTYVLYVCMLALVCLIPFRIYESEKQNKKTKNKREVLKYNDEKYTDFLEIYEEIIRNANIIDLVEKRKKIQKYCVMWGSIVVFTFLISLVIFLFVDEIYSAITFLLLSSIVCIVIISAIRNIKNKFKIYSIEYKNKIISNIIKLVDEEMEYANISENFEMTEVAKNMYMESNFDYKRFDKFEADDYFVGKINEKSYQIYDVDVIKIVQNKGRKFEESIFRGLFAIMQFETSVSDEIRLVNKKIFKLSKEYVKELTDIELNKNFVVYSKNKLLAMQIFTSDFVQILNDYVEKFDMKFEIVLKNSNIFVRFYSGPMFEPLIFEDKVNKELLYFYYYTLFFVRNVIQNIDRALLESEL